jgi:hypothetical protein
MQPTTSNDVFFGAASGDPQVEQNRDCTVLTVLHLGQLVPAAEVIINPSLGLQTRSPHFPHLRAFGSLFQVLSKCFHTALRYATI